MAYRSRADAVLIPIATSRTLPARSSLVTKTRGGSSGIKGKQEDPQAFCFTPHRKCYGRQARLPDGARSSVDTSTETMRPDRCGKTD